MLDNDVVGQQMGDYVSRNLCMGIFDSCLPGQVGSFLLKVLPMSVLAMMILIAMALMRVLPAMIRHFLIFYNQIGYASLPMGVGLSTKIGLELQTRMPLNVLLYHQVSEVRRILQGYPFGVLYC